jgi:26S proteasome regulatory subunit N2
MFAYPPMTAPPTEEKVEKVATAVLSTTAKAKARAKKLEKEKTGDSMEMDEKETSESTAAAKSPEEPTEKKPEEEKDNSKKEEEPLTEELSNLSRVVPAQIPCIKLKSDSRYGPIKKVILPIEIVSNSKTFVGCIRWNSAVGRSTAGSTRGTDRV